MAAFLNKVQIIGNVVKDPVVKTISNNGEDSKVANITIATNRVWKDKAGKEQSEAQFTPVVLWRNLAELTEKYVKTGKKIYIEGHLKTRDYEDKDGAKRYVTEVVGENIILLGANGQADGSGEPVFDEKVAAPVKTAAKKNDDKVIVDDIPF